MKTATITAAKAQFRALIDQVRHGETILIVDRGQPVARLESVLTEGIDDSEGRLVRLERAGLIRRGITPPHSFLLKNLLRLRTKQVSCGRYSPKGKNLGEVLG